MVVDGQDPEFVIRVLAKDINQTIERHEQGQDIFQGRTWLAFVKENLRSFGSRLIRSLVVDEVILDVSFSQFQSSLIHLEIRIDLMIFSDQIGSIFH